VEAMKEATLDTPPSLVELCVESLIIRANELGEAADQMLDAMGRHEALQRFREVCRQSLGHL
jgi:hypothetical protein